ncbi:MAG: ribosomal RNA small subunit methyltransferase A [Planctomycetes bacterium]|jgi:16S rRNA (adenine1518-N6/adenine1519-N6)-dimethyltransferase|nr:ribosomal RNA small subunit methyltransferase A [Planctomycetota bacterium]
MQTLAQIRALLEEAGLSPRRMFGQNFLIDLNLMNKVLELADVDPSQPVLEVGPGTGSLTEALLETGAKVVAVEIDRGLHALLANRFADRPNIRLIHADILAGKHAVNPAVLGELGSAAQLVSNLPYNIATPLVAQCLLDTWSAMHGESGLCRFSRLTFTVQLEVAQRMSAGPGDEEYGPISVLAGLLGRMTVGPVIPATAFWPQPKVNSRILRIDFDEQAADRIKNAADLAQIIFLAFNQRRKQIGPILQRRLEGATGADVEAALKLAGVEPQQRAQSIKPEQFMLIANSLPQTPR